MALFERVLFANSRASVRSQADGDLLEVAIGTGPRRQLHHHHSAHVGHT